MTKVRYTITIHTARTNTLRLNKNIKYKGQSGTAVDDSVQFFIQKTFLEALGTVNDYRLMTSVNTSKAQYIHNY